MDKQLHIICLNVPYPVNYGGVYDLFYKLPALQRQGVNIHLHCFLKDRREQPELNKYCEHVYYYKRNTGRKAISSKLPYIVASRNSETLLQRLLEDDHPILMEGVHSTYLTTDKRFDNRKKFVRLHNVEAEYYQQLFKHSRNLKKKLYYRREAKLLAAYERKLSHNAAAFWTVTEKDAAHYKMHYDCPNVEYLPLFIPEWEVTSQEGMGTHCLYHGNLEVEENEKAACWLLKNVFQKLDVPLVIAGNNPSKKIIDLVKANPQASLAVNPSEKQMQDVIAKAHINVLPSFNSTGIKIKLVNALFNGRHCVVNKEMIEGTRLAEMCHVLKSATEFKERISFLYHEPLTTAEKELRKTILPQEFCNEENAKQIIKTIWNE